MSFTIQDLSTSTALDQAAMTAVRGGFIVAGRNPPEPFGGYVLPPLPPGTPPSLAQLLNEFFAPPAPLGVAQPD